jgi:hypothetical protein
VRGPIQLRFPPDCWLLMQEMLSLPTPVPLAADVQAILSRGPRIEMHMPIPEPRLLVAMTRPQAEALQRWLHALLDGLSHDHHRRLTCLECISRVGGALRLSGP